MAILAFPILSNVRLQLPRALQHAAVFVPVRIHEIKMNNDTKLHMHESTKQRSAPLLFMLHPSTVVYHQWQAQCQDTDVATLHFRSAEEMLPLIGKEGRERPACVISEIDLPGMSGIDMLSKITSATVAPSVVLTSTSVDVAQAVDAMKLGAYSILQSPFSNEELQKEISEAIATYQRRYDMATRLAILEQCYRQLTPRESQILDKLLIGRPNKSIARSLDLSVRTIENDRAQIFSKFGVENATELAAKATELKYLKRCLRCQVHAASAISYGPHNATTPSPDASSTSCN